MERAEALARGRAAAARPPARREAAQGGALAQQAFVALADNVRDYAVFLLEPSGHICYWGEGARLMKWWHAAEAEGSHLRMLYPDGGGEDGTAEAHLREAAELGEYIGEGQRVRRDGSTFWAGVSLTALRDAGGTLIGFAKTTRDLTVRRAAEAALAVAWSAARERDAARTAEALAHRGQEDAEERLEFALEQVRGARAYATEVLQRDLGDLTFEHAAVLREMAIMHEEIHRLHAARAGGATQG